MAPVISIVLCTRNRSALLRRALASLRGIDYPRDRCELVLIDNASSDDTGAVAARFAKEASFPVCSLREERIGLSAARNCAIAAARGDYLFFTDDDQLVDPQALAEHERVARAYDSRVQQGAIELSFPGGRPEWLRGELATILGKTHDKPEGPQDIDLYGGNMLIRRDVFDEVTGFREDLGKGAAGYSEDIELTRRLKQRGETIVYAPSARIYHVIERDRAHPGFFVKNSFDKGYSDGLLLGGGGLPREAAGLPRVAWRFGVASLGALARRDRHAAIVARTRAANQLGRLWGCASSIGRT